MRKRGIAFEPHLYSYKEHGGTSHSATELGVPEHTVIKTLVMETDDREPIIVLMNGDCEVSTKALSRRIGAKSISPCDPAAAQRYTGYQVGGTSPFGTRRTMRVFVERTIFDLEKIYINGGKRGFLVSLNPLSLRTILPVVEVEVAIQTR
ncbi:MAG TPA: aminoacyl-tRNA deacylase [Blastocatellia bacterium]|nr:aminoacyl-tRNA deacylase [Blastocatellia bacterium]